mmetsp:Transcript_14015/g.39644  ORF Transcript_14015/g.39644 Transcript_14015/m.39644 type:complete len:130 (+) Transcript_14015:557-946(+)
MLVIFFWPLAWLPCALPCCYSRYQVPVYGHPSDLRVAPPSWQHEHQATYTAHQQPAGSPRQSGPYPYPPAPYYQPPVAQPSHPPSYEPAVGIPVGPRPNASAPSPTAPPMAVVEVGGSSSLAMPPGKNV